MTDQNDDYVYDERQGNGDQRRRWLPLQLLPEASKCAGKVLDDGASVALIKDLKVKGAGQSLKQGTVIKSIRLTDNPDEIDCRHDAIKGLVLRTEFVRRR